MVSGWQTKISVSPGPGLWSLVLGPFGPDLGTELNLTWDLDLDLSLTIIIPQTSCSAFVSVHRGVMEVNVSGTGDLRLNFLALLLLVQ